MYCQLSPRRVFHYPGPGLIGFTQCDGIRVPGLIGPSERLVGYFGDVGAAEHHLGAAPRKASAYLRARGSEGLAPGAEPVSGLTLRRQPTLTPAVTSASVSGVGISARFSLTGSAGVNAR
ncbi:MAG: hypothetical protein E2P02_17170 [Acidobacteria bacterium]|nr:MAG: hypothetical protein E2P02_17170 [Acidobacteriota bacterium]